MSGAGDELPECWRRALSDNGWRYKGEGNANVVLAVPADGTVLRVMKEGGGGTAETVLVRARYCDAVRRAFMGGYADVPVPVRVSAEQLCHVDRRLRALTGCRLPDRLPRGVACAAGLAAVCPDYTVLRGAAPGPVHCVEIKPKQGWLHAADRRDDAGKCRFCAHQYAKLCRGRVPCVSRYCPLDLFSGRRDRVRRAVRQLLRTPQNNLKMFVDGVPLDDDRDGGGGFARAASAAFGDEHRFAEFVAAALLGDFANVEYDDDMHDHREPLSGCELDATAPMSADCVLHKILTMQQMQTTGFAAVCSAYDRSPRSAAQFGHVDRLARAAGAGAVALDPLDGYLVAATAHDCSVFVTFSSVQTPSDPVGQRRDVAVVRYGAGWYAVRVKVSDLDPKPLSTVDKHRKRNGDALLACARYSGRGCPSS